MPLITPRHVARHLLFFYAMLIFRRFFAAVTFRCLRRCRYYAMFDTIFFFAALYTPLPFHFFFFFAMPPLRLRYAYCFSISFDSGIFADIIRCVYLMRHVICYYVRLMPTYAFDDAADSPLI